MIIRDKIVNSPSDGSERAVGNSLMIVSTAPKGDLSSIQVSPDYCRIFNGESIVFDVSSWDENYNKLSIDKSLVTYTVPEGFGTVTDGKFTSQSWNNTGYIVVNYQGLSDSVFVYQQQIIDLTLYPDAALTDTTHSVNFSITLKDNDNDDHGLSFAKEQM